MTTAEMTTRPPVLPGGLDSAAFSAVREENPVLKAKREQAYREFSALPAPTARDEEWRRTDPALFPLATLRRPAPLQASDRADSVPTDADFDVVVSIDDRGFHIADRTGLLAKGTIGVWSLAEAAQRHPELLARHLRGPAFVKGARYFAALNDAFWNVGVLIHVPARTAVEKGILIRYRHRAGGAVLPRLVMVVEAGSQATVAEHYLSENGVPFMAVASREMYVAQGANLKVVSLQEWGDETCHIGEDWARIERDAKIDWVTLLLGGKVGKMMVGCDCREPNSQAWLSGLYFADGAQHIDQRTLQLHSAPHTYSNLLYKGAVKDSGHSVYQGIIDASPGAIKVDAYQMNNNLVLNDGARADSLPGLEIDADDLKCSHGSTMGNLDEAQTFYLQCRGIPEQAARRMLVEAFFEEVVSRVPFAFMQERVREHVKRKMG